MWRVARKLFFAGSHQNQAVSLPHRSEAVGLARVYAQALLRWKQMQSIWDGQDGYNMLPRRKGTAVGLTSWKSNYLFTIYRYVQDLGGSQVSHSLDDQATSILARCSHGSRRARSPCITRLASREGEAGERNNEQATDMVVISFHAKQRQAIMY